MKRRRDKIIVICLSVAIAVVICYKGYCGMQAKPSCLTDSALTLKQRGCYDDYEWCIRGDLLVAALQYEEGLND